MGGGLCDRRCGARGSERSRPAANGNLLRCAPRSLLGASVLRKLDLERFFPTRPAPGDTEGFWHLEVEAAL